MKQNELTAIVWKEGKQYVSLCPQLDVSSFGSTKKQALDKLKEATLLYIETAKELKLPLPTLSASSRLVLPLKLPY